jgi:sulfate-transporting ATPase
MENILQFVLLGLGTGGIYALLGLGLVFIYRGSGVVNFAHTGIALVSAVVFYETYGVKGWPLGLAIAVALIASVLSGLVVQFMVMRPLRRASPLMRIVATLAVLAIVESAVDQVYGGVGVSVKSFLPEGALHLFGTAVGQDQAIILLISCVLTVILWQAYKRTRFGLATTAVAENELIPASIGWSPNAIASINWGLGALLAGLAGVLISPIVGLDGDSIGLLIVPALTVALIAGFSSFPLTLLGGLVLGILQSEATLATTNGVLPTGASDFVPLILIVGLLVLRGRSIPVRGYLADRLPRLSSGQIKPLWVIIGLAALYVSTQIFTTNWTGAITASFTAGIICLSLVVVTGYCGQLSLAQYAFAGLGALFSAHMAYSWHLEFILATLIAMVITIVIGTILALPAVRLRGVNLAVVTLSIAVVVNSAVLTNSSYTGGIVGLTVPTPSIFGLQVGAVADPFRYAIVVVIAFALVGIAVANLRRGRVGRRLVAVRSNERAAASLGISVSAAKLYAFALAAGIAACGGALMVFEDPSAYFGAYDPLASITIVLDAVVGGIGYASGAIMGGASVQGGMAQQTLSTFFNTQGWFTVFASVVLLIVVITHHDGVVNVTIMSYKTAKSFVIRTFRNLFPSRQLVPAGVGAPADVTGGMVAPQSVSDTPARVVAGPSFRSGESPSPADVGSLFNAKTLEFRDIAISFGGVRAVDGVSLTVHPGEVVGLIGPNGAGKTTILDIATGFDRRYSGSVLLGGVPIDNLNAVKRARAGLIRSFQNLELFDDLSVEENIRAASEPRNRLAYLSDLVYPKKMPLSSVAKTVVEDFGLTADSQREPTELHLAQRRLLAVARAVAARPSVLLLDEPAAGLDETSRHELGDTVRRLAESWGLGVLLIEHDVSLVLSTCDRVMVLEFGKVIAADTAENIAQHEGVIKAYLGTSGKTHGALTPAEVGQGAER